MLNLDKLSSAIFNDIVSGLSGYEATISISIELIKDEIIYEYLALLKKYSRQNAIPRKDLFYALNCVEIDCKSLDKCCVSSGCDIPIAHFEIPQIANDYGELAIEFIGSTDKAIKFKVYTSPNTLQYHKYKTRGKEKPYVYIDTTPNENNMYDGYLFNAPLLERLTVIAIFKDPRLVQEFSCCNSQDAENFTWLASEIQTNIVKRKITYYRNLYQLPQPNNLVPK